MCGPVSEGGNAYRLNFVAFGRCEMGHYHEVSEAKSVDSFADAFKATREFWTANKGREITVTLKISKTATDHLKAGI